MDHFCTATTIFDIWHRDSIFFLNLSIWQVDVSVSQNMITDVSGDASEAEVLSQALHEKVIVRRRGFS